MNHLICSKLQYQGMPILSAIYETHLALHHRSLEQLEVALWCGAIPGRIIMTLIWMRSITKNHRWGISRWRGRKGTALQAETLMMATEPTQPGNSRSGLPRASRKDY